MGENISAKGRTPSDRVDICVVGAGPAGALAAYSLAERGHTVVVLEAGPRFEFEDRIERMQRHLRPAYKPPDVWDMGGKRDDYTNSGEVTYPLNTRRVKGIGGSSLHWGARLERLHEKDFEMHSRYGVADDWPISYWDLQPYYLKAERALGASGPPQLPFGPPREEPHPNEAFPPSYSDRLLIDAAEELGITTHRVAWAINSEPYDGRSECLGYGTCWPVCPSGAKYSADVHIEKAEGEGARVLDRVPVQRFITDSTGDRLESAEYVTPEGETYEQEAREFVLACGGVENPRLLLLSESPNHPDGLGNSSGLVGRYFEERPTAVLQANVDTPTRQQLIGFGTTECHQFYDVEGVPPGSIKMEFDNNAGLNIARLALSRGTTLSDIQDVATNPKRIDELLRGSDAVWGDELLESMQASYGNQLQLSAAVEELPTIENRITLNPDVTDDHGNAVPDISWSRSDYAGKTMDFAFEIMHSILDRLDANVLSRREIRFWKGIGHQIGTTRMGNDPHQSVVDAQLRAHDLNNLSILGSSVFVTGGAMQPTLTIAALSLRAADHIEERL